MEPKYVTRSDELREQRLHQLAELGINAVKGPWLGSITIAAGNLPDLIARLRRLDKIERKDRP